MSKYIEFYTRRFDKCKIFPAQEYCPTKVYYSDDETYFVGEEGTGYLCLEIPAFEEGDVSKNLKIYGDKEYKYLVDGNKIVLQWNEDEREIRFQYYKWMSENQFDYAGYAYFELIPKVTMEHNYELYVKNGGNKEEKKKDKYETLDKMSAFMCLITIPFLLVYVFILVLRLMKV